MSDIQLFRLSNGVTRGLVPCREARKAIAGPHRRSRYRPNRHSQFMAAGAAHTQTTERQEGQ